MKKPDLQSELELIIKQMGSVAVAVSGGIDSMTLAHIVQRKLGKSALMFHALSPAVPKEATERVKAHAKDGGWRLQLINANEMQDPSYLENPVNRCFFCKTNLYSRIAHFTSELIVSGTNSDDLNDFRPGLEAAKTFQVRHPFVEVGINKKEIRAIAAGLGLNDIKSLPAAPCLSSRIETGLRVTNEKLVLIDNVERLLTMELGIGTIRCRITHPGVVIELEETLLQKVSHDLQLKVDDTLRLHGYPGNTSYVLYRQGSAFLREQL
ncbi:adenine nucleotide alpha hydrolase [Alphaproteobacteria bacterium]|jgi:uncharacterized protein|nr:adenine nucleotide alpha hydrolase [Alphaproteobacteria bacterium]|tara:strand:- start:1639 stop:2436 length:798 start_codon:yes stop_codon:yes gene_type:complete